ncbi:MAG: DUF4124 domain-containing protein [Burkholderiales bacterium]
MLALAAPASAQLYKWVDKDGRTRYTDQPPPAGVASKTFGAPAQPAAPAADAAADAAADSAAKAAPAAELTPVQQEQAFRKRQLEEKQAEEKAEAAHKDAAIKQANCERARSALATYDSGQRVTRTGADGERYYIDDETRAKEASAAVQAVKDWCQ